MSRRMLPGLLRVVDLVVACSQEGSAADGLGNAFLG